MSHPRRSVLALSRPRTPPEVWGMVAGLLLLALVIGSAHGCSAAQRATAGRAAEAAAPVAAAAIPAPLGFIISYACTAIGAALIGSVHGTKRERKKAARVIIPPAKMPPSPRSN